MKICVPMIASENFTVNTNYQISKLILIFETTNYYFQILNVENWTYEQLIDYLYNSNVSNFMSNNISLQDEQLLQSKRIKIYPLDCNCNALDNAVKLKQSIDEQSKNELRPQTFG